MISKQVAVIICVALGYASAVPSSTWDNFKRTYDKKYADIDEEMARKAIFKQTLREVLEFNSKHAEQVGYQKGINHLSDQSLDEYNEMNGITIPDSWENSPMASEFVKQVPHHVSGVPSEFDWRKVDGRVSAVKDQGQYSCKSAWAFATTGVLEGQMVVQKNFSKSGELIPLSEQMLIDCDHFNTGCGGGNVFDSLRFIKKNGGIMSESDYPYKGLNDQCSFLSRQVVMRDSGAGVLERDSEENLKNAVAKIGPVAVAMVATANLKNYKSGVFSDVTCNEQKLNHAALLVGYGTDPKQGDYWIVKNSWSSDWGEDGYFKLARNKNNHCGIASMAVIPLFGAAVNRHA